MFIKKRREFIINGQVMDELSRIGIEGLRVEAWDKDFIFDDFVSSTFTMKQGIFQMIIKESYFREIFFDQRPDLYFKIYRDDELIKNTEDSGILWNLEAGETKVVIEVEMNSSSNCPELTYGVFGIVCDNDKQPVKGATVKVLDHFDELYTLLAETQSDLNGQYATEFCADAFRKNTGAGRSGPNLVAQVFDQTGEKIGQSRQVDNAKPMTKLDIDINTTQYRVFGVVSNSAGQPLRNVKVKAFDCDMRWEEQIGKETRTSITGFFEIKYSFVQFQRSEKLLADLIVRVYDEQDKELVSAGIFFNADPEMEVNLYLPGGDSRGPSEFDNLVREITPLLRNVPQHDLNEKDVDFLAAETGIDRRYIEWLAESARRHVEAATIDQFVFYGLFRQNLPTALGDLLGYDLPTLRDALEKSSQNHIIRYLPSNEIDAIMTKLGALQADHATMPGGTGEPSSLGDLLRTVLSDMDKIRAVAQLYIAHKNLVSDQFFAELEALILINNQELIGIRLALQLGELSGIYLPLVRELQYMASTDPLYAPTGNLSPYVRLTLNDWKELLHRTQSNGEIIGAPATVPGNDMEEKIATYAISLSQQLESTFPATTIVRRIEADTGADSPFKDSHADLMTFFSNNPSFDLSTEPLDIYLSTDADTKLSGIVNKELFTTTFKGMQRTSKLTNNDFAGIRALMRENLSSGVAVAAVGELPFIERFSSKLGGEEIARGVYQTAQHVQNTAMAVYMKHNPAFQSPLPYVIGGRSRTSTNKIVRENTTIPEWSKLFGSLEMCECHHCRSLYSPSAYLVDTLNFIRKTAKKCNDKNALDNLLLRRPDIEHIELTCENANTPMPYVDLVNEILEAHIVSREFQIGYSIDITANLDNKIIDNRLIEEFNNIENFKNKYYTLTKSASVRINTLGLKWTIVDSGWVFQLLHQENSEFIIITAWPQTSRRARELHANPEHTHSDAYDKLRSAVYPWDLPFNLPIEETRVYLQHLGVYRHEVLSIFKRGESPDPESDLQLTYEYLGLTSEEAQIITGKTKGDPASSEPGPWDFWGLSKEDNDIPDPVDNSMSNIKGTWIQVLVRIHIFLNRSGLSYRELLALLMTYYFNPRNDTGGPFQGRSIIIHSIDEDQSTCNTAKLFLFLIGQDYESMFSRAHRFTRLSRKLRWSVQDLDKAFEAFRPRNKDGRLDITDDFLIQLSHIQRLFAEKNIPIVNLLSLWSYIDYTPYVDYFSDGEPAIPSLYNQLFRSKTLESTVFPDHPSDLKSLGLKISEHTATIAAAFGIGTDDIDRLRADSLVILPIPNPDPTDPVKLIQDDNLTYENLCLLYRHALLARIVALPIHQYLVTLRLIAKDPFAPKPSSTPSESKLNTTMTLDFINKVKCITDSSFSVDDLDYLLRHAFESESEFVISEGDIGTALDVIRADLRQIAAENTIVDQNVTGDIVTTDPHGEQTRKKLALLNWSLDEINLVIAILNNNYNFEAELLSLDKSIKFPTDLADQISYDVTTQRLRFKGVMSSSEKSQLLEPPNDQDPLFEAAVNFLYDTPRKLINRHMRRFSVPIFQSEKFSLPNNVTFPNTLNNKVFYDRTVQKLSCIGVMREAEKNVLSGLSNDAKYVGAVNFLFDAPETSVLQDSDIFLTSDEANQILGDPTPAERFGRVLQKLMNYLRPMLSQRMVKQRFVEHTGLDASTVDGLLNAWVYEPGTTGSSRPLAMAVFVNAEFAGSNSELPVTPTAFPQQFSTYLLLHKIAAAIGKFTLNADLVKAVFEHGADRKWLNLNLLPLAKAEDAYSLFSDWSRLANLAQLRNTLPRGRAIVDDWLSAAYETDAKPGDILKALSQAAQWNSADLNRLSESTGFNLISLDSLRSEANLKRLAEAMVMLKKMRANAEQCLAWTETKTGGELIKRDRNQAEDVKSLVRAKYEPTQWLEVAGKLRDLLRDKQRAALVSYLVAHPYFVIHPNSTKGQTWNDVNGLYGYLLIDVEMSSCMVTTRIKQAISSVQLYIQRTLMNLEECAVLDEDQGKQWRTWRKQYRIWEANRKVLLYPENWLEPELRDDKTPFFKDLENELLQNDITADVAEDVFIHYLEKLDQVARLDIVGMYEDPVEQSQSIFNGEDIQTELHVIGRTAAVPHVYFYRHLEKTIWSPWEKVELDIEGDHLIPVVWNHHFYLFWAIFTEKSEKPTPDQRAKNVDPIKYWEIKLAWSIYKHNGWSSKKFCNLPLKVRMDESDLGQETFTRFSFKTRTIKNSVDYRSLRIQCFGPYVHDPIIPAPAPPPFNKQSINLPLPARGFPAYQFTLNGHSLNSSVKSSISIISQASDPSITREYDITKDDAVVVFPPDSGSLTFVIIKSDLYEIKNYELREHNYQYSLYDVDLKSYQKRATLEPTLARAYSPIVEAFQCLGEFSLDDCNDHLDVRVIETFGSNSTSLKPFLLGTKILGMETVEETSAASALGATKVLSQTPGEPYRLLFDAKYRELTKKGSLEFPYPFFFKDEKRTYFIKIKWKWYFSPNLQLVGYRPALRFSTFYHPHVCEFIRALKQHGIDGMLTLDNQKLTDYGAGFRDYGPNWSVIYPSTPIENVDFHPEGEYSLYNWELFFHAPFLIAMQLSKNQRFELAQRWFHYIFDPTITVSSDQGPEIFWRVLPFFEEAKRGIQTLEELLADTEKLEEQVRVSGAKPFNPHAIARMRIVVYMKTVVMHYIDNLLAWGDQLFGQDTIESINEATQLYILAAEILGKRPESIPLRVTAKVQTYNTLYEGDEPDSDSLPNALVEVEGYIFPSATPVSVDRASPIIYPIPYFCTSSNDKLLNYWDFVADRLFKIRHCLNLAGVERKLPIYEPPIDPALLVRAAAAGVDLSSALSDTNAAAPHYRFGVMLPKATELCNDLKSLGGALLSALEKRDVEALALLRSSHEINVLKAVRQIKEQQAKEASATLEGLNEYKKVVTARQQYYQSREYMNQSELAQIVLTGASLKPMSMQLGAEVTAAVLNLIPESKLGGPTTAGTTFGGRNVAGAVQAFGSVAGTTASMLSTQGSIAATLGGYQRRKEDWTHQADLATKELNQVAKQILAAEIRLAIAERELENHDLQIENSQEVDAFMRDKFTNQELYNWMVGQLSAVYFQSYQLAYDVAKRAERAYRFELGLQDSNFIQFGYWDSLKKGLLAGERLHYDLKRMDVVYLDQNRREYEMTKHISLAALDPMALVKLKETQSCFISLPEVLFDLDHSGHYLRRIKSVSVTIPCVTGPYSGVHCTLTLLNSSIRHSNMLLSNKYERSQPDDVRFTDTIGAIQSIVTSTGQNDTGMFETNLHDERYLPFEGTGVISEWRLELPENFHQFDYETISDVILHFRYTARDGGKILADGASQVVIRNQLNALRQLADGQSGLVQMLSLRNEYPTQWNQLRSGAEGKTVITLNKARFPYFVSRESVELIHFAALARVSEIALAPEKTTLDEFALKLVKMNKDSKPSVTLNFQAQSDLGDWRVSDQFSIPPTEVTLSDNDTRWDLVLEEASTLNVLELEQRALLEDIILLVGYRI